MFHFSKKKSFYTTAYRTSLTQTIDAGTYKLSDHEKPPAWSLAFKFNGRLNMPEWTYKFGNKRNGKKYTLSNNP